MNVQPGDAGSVLMIMRSWSLAALVVLCVAVLTSTAIRFEVLNAAAEGVLPSREFRDDGSRVKWRLDPQPTTETESAENRLRGIVGTWGLVQYPLAVTTVVCSIVLVRRGADRQRVLGVVGCLAGCGALGLAMWRSYFTSLGW